MDWSSLEESSAGGILKLNIAAGKSRIRSCEFRAEAATVLDGHRSRHTEIIYTRIICTCCDRTRHYIVCVIANSHTAAQKDASLGLLRAVGNVAIYPESLIDAVKTRCQNSESYPCVSASGSACASGDRSRTDAEMEKQLVRATVSGVGELL